jgi:hypothetical protein
LSSSSTLLPWRWRQHASLEHWLLPACPHGTKTQKNIFSKSLFFFSSLAVSHTTWI